MRSSARISAGRLDERTTRTGVYSAFALGAIAMIVAAFGGLTPLLGGG